jgi:hypothetical protein
LSQTCLHSRLPPSSPLRSFFWEGLSLQAKQRSAPPQNHGPASRRAPQPSAESAPLPQPLYCLSTRPTSPPYPAPQVLFEALFFKNFWPALLLAAHSIKRRALGRSEADWVGQMELRASILDPNLHGRGNPQPWERTLQPNKSAPRRWGRGGGKCAYGLGAPRRGGRASSRYRGTFTLD